MPAISIAFSPAGVPDDAAESGGSGLQSMPGHPETGAGDVRDTGADRDDWITPARRRALLKEHRDVIRRAE